MISRSRKNKRIETHSNTKFNKVSRLNNMFPMKILEDTTRFYTSFDVENSKKKKKKICGGEERIKHTCERSYSYCLI